MTTLLVAGAGVIALALVVVSIYPGELSYLGGALHRWLYDLGASSYERKWRSAAYRDHRFRDVIAEHAERCCDRSGSHDALDLGCGTGRATRVTAPALAKDSRFVAVDFAPAMLRQFDQWLARDENGDLRRRVELVRSDIGRWLRDEPATGRFGVVLLLEVGEFLPDLPEVLCRSAALLATGGGIVMTRPAGLFWLLFPGRRQSRRGLTRLLVDSGFEAVRFVPWRARYELVLATKRRR